MRAKSNILIATAVAALTLFIPRSLLAESYGLVVAIEDYSKVGAIDLPGTANDAQSVKEMLIKSFGYPEANVRTLVNAEATKAAVLRELDGVIEKAKPGDSVAFYFSGHGCQVPDANDDDERDDRLDEALVTSDFSPHSVETWLLDDHLRHSLSKSKTKRVLVVLDTCHAGTGTRGSVTKSADFGFVQMLGRGDRDKSTELSSGLDSHVLMAACAANEVAAMGNFDGAKHSLFTAALLRVLPRMMTSPLQDLSAAIQAEMRMISPKQAELQTPQIETAISASLQAVVGPSEAVPAALAEEVQRRPEQRPADGLPSAFPVMIATDKRVYSDGDAMVASVKSDQPGYLRLYYVDKTGTANLIFPNYYQKENRIEAGKPIEVGSAAHPFLFRMLAPAGTELLLAAVSPEQFTDHQALNFTPQSPTIEMGDVKSIRELVDQGTKAISVESRVDSSSGSSPVAPVQIGRAICIYDIKEK